MIKKMNDFVLAVIMLVLGLVLLLGNFTVGGTTMGQGGLLARPDMWLKAIAALMVFFSIVLGIKSLSFKKGEEQEKFTFAINWTVVLTLVALVLYTIFLPIIGFFISTFLLSFFLCTLYAIKEDDKKVKELTRQEWVRYLLRSLIFSAVMVVLLYLIFGKLLAIQLP